MKLQRHREARGASLIEYTLIMMAVGAIAVLVLGIVGSRLSGSLGGVSAGFGQSGTSNGVTNGGMQMAPAVGIGHHLPAPVGITTPKPIGSGGSVPTPTPTSTSTPTPTPTPVPGSVKPELAGLVDRQGAPSAAEAPDLSGWVVNVTWAELQPTAGTTITSDNPIDQAIAQVDQNPAYRGMHLRIRVMAGIDSPNWVEAMSGGPVYVYNTQDQVGGDVPRFWTAPVEQAYANLQVLLAAKYDSDPEIEDVNMSGCMTVYAEPLIREITSSETVTDLLAAGYTEAADQSCQEDQINAQAVWVHTHSSIALNPYDVINANGSVSVDEAFTATLINYCRTTLGERCTLGNDSIRSTSLGSAYDDMYNSIAGAGPGIYFQTAQAAKVGNLQTTIQWAIDEGSNDVELPAGWSSLITSAQMAQDNQALLANQQ